ncbi:hypothetical protein [Mycolicibacterium holsaticum]|uniref:hypothetical protein n=1 Tax=Mycolicibacterium holsaticum TaxID=152142 RepID=UPI001C7D0ECC|nr:hypothetical protein [Mycolicibacterium holsaticum]MDA4107525.1 hypothetical protein [Mycolicibacterium holsaticum DSM 44478 = JCM 12374]QZA15570.1 hypothetical protein K3U96_18335 [Mycolicibacterium holsaticum DSM 44478 = JCM 12374]UNC12719.1 hypothetical protein H5U41_08495 [Mycolicibacterium holsaticum DSM 44478 = JCM 12374]
MMVSAVPTRLGHTDCERIAGVALAQPVLAVTSLAYVVVGIAAPGTCFPLSQSVRRPGP